MESPVHVFPRVSELSEDASSPDAFSSSLRDRSDSGAFAVHGGRAFNSRIKHLEHGTTSPFPETLNEEEEGDVPPKSGGGQNGYAFKETEMNWIHDVSLLSHESTEEEALDKKSTSFLKNGRVVSQGSGYLFSSLVEVPDSTGTAPTVGGSGRSLSAGLEEATLPDSSQNQPLAALHTGDSRRIASQDPTHPAPVAKDQGRSVSHGKTVLAAPETDDKLQSLDASKGEGGKGSGSGDVTKGGSPPFADRSAQSTPSPEGVAEPVASKVKEKVREFERQISGQMESITSPGYSPRSRSARTSPVPPPGLQLAAAEAMQSPKVSEREVIEESAPYGDESTVQLPVATQSQSPVLSSGLETAGWKEDTNLLSEAEGCALGFGNAGKVLESFTDKASAAAAARVVPVNASWDSDDFIVLTPDGTPVKREGQAKGEGKGTGVEEARIGALREISRVEDGAERKELSYGEVEEEVESSREIAEVISGGDVEGHTATTGDDDVDNAEAAFGEGGDAAAATGAVVVEAMPDEGQMKETVEVNEEGTNMIPEGQVDGEKMNRDVRIPSAAAAAEEETGIGAATGALEFEPLPGDNTFSEFKEPDSEAEASVMEECAVTGDGSVSNFKDAVLESEARSLEEEVVPGNNTDPEFMDTVPGTETGEAGEKMGAVSGTAEGQEQTDTVGGSETGESGKGAGAVVNTLEAQRESKAGVTAGVAALATTGAVAEVTAVGVAASAKSRDASAAEHDSSKEGNPSRTLQSSDPTPQLPPGSSSVLSTVHTAPPTPFPSPTIAAATPSPAASLQLLPPAAVTVAVATATAAPAFDHRLSLVPSKVAALFPVAEVVEEEEDSNLSGSGPSTAKEGGSTAKGSGGMGGGGFPGSGTEGRVPFVAKGVERIKSLGSTLSKRMSLKGDSVEGPQQRAVDPKPKEEEKSAGLSWFWDLFPCVKPGSGDSTGTQLKKQPSAGQAARLRAGANPGRALGVTAVGSRIASPSSVLTPVTSTSSVVGRSASPSRVLTPVTSMTSAVALALGPPLSASASQEVPAVEEYVVHRVVQLAVSASSQESTPRHPSSAFGLPAHERGYLSSGSDMAPLQRWAPHQHPSRVPPMSPSSLMVSRAGTRYYVGSPGYGAPGESPLNPHCYPAWGVQGGQRGGGRRGGWVPGDSPMTSSFVSPASTPGRGMGRPPRPPARGGGGAMGGGGRMGVALRGRSQTIGVLRAKGFSPSSQSRLAGSSYTVEDILDYPGSTLHSPLMQSRAPPSLPFLPVKRLAQHPNTDHSNEEEEPHTGCFPLSPNMPLFQGRKSEDVRERDLDLDEEGAHTGCFPHGPHLSFFQSRGQPMQQQQQQQQGQVQLEEEGETMKGGEEKEREKDMQRERKKAKAEAGHTGCGPAGPLAFLLTCASMGGGSSKLVRTISINSDEEESEDGNEQVRGRSVAGAEGSRASQSASGQPAIVEESSAGSKEGTERGLGPVPSEPAPSTEPAPPPKPTVPRIDSGLLGFADSPTVIKKKAPKKNNVRRAPPPVPEEEGSREASPEKKVGNPGETVIQEAAAGTPATAVFAALGALRGQQPPQQQQQPQQQRQLQQQQQQQQQQLRPRHAMLEIEEEGSSQFDDASSTVSTVLEVQSEGGAAEGYATGRGLGGWGRRLERTDTEAAERGRRGRGGSPKNRDLEDGVIAGLLQQQRSLNAAPLSPKRKIQKKKKKRETPSPASFASPASFLQSPDWVALALANQY